MDKCVPKRAMPNARENKSLAEGSQHLLRRKNRNAAEPAEILDIESEQVPDFLHMHCCYQARHGPGYLRPSLQQRFCATPEVLLLCRRQERTWLHSGMRVHRLFHSESEAVPITRSRTNVPEFCQVLRWVEKLRSARPKTIRTLPDRSIFGAVRLHEAEQNVRVHQVGRSWH
jgi:hypothetical protein